MTKDIKPPFNEETAYSKVKAAQDAWNARNPELVAQAYTTDSRWRNRTEFFAGRQAIVKFLKRKWAKELDYRRYYYLTTNGDASDWTRYRSPQTKI